MVAVNGASCSSTTERMRWASRVRPDWACISYTAKAVLISCTISAVCAAVLFLLDAAMNIMAVPAIDGMATGLPCSRGARNWAVRDSSAAVAAKGPGACSSRQDHAANAPDTSRAAFAQVA
ncbi:hypothetical protein AHiyo1_43920 [Arthrobacter sp. Hiyo1]|nr:hypothetical protein AHiyo1_43920 [Arthrobacter sp. Hiyo1]